MKLQPIISYNPTFGILKSYKKTHYGEYTKGVYKDYNVEIYNAYKHNQKLIYVSDNLKNWVKSKLFYIQDGVRKILRSERK